MTTELWFAVAIVGSFILGSLTQSHIYNQHIKLSSQAAERRRRQESLHVLMSNFGKDQDDE